MCFLTACWNTKIHVIREKKIKYFMIVTNCKAFTKEYTIKFTIFRSYVHVGAVGFQYVFVANNMLQDFIQNFAITF